MFGLARLDRSGVRFFTRRDGLVSNDVRFLAEDREGTLWIDTSDGLSRLAGDRPGGGPTQHRPGGGPTKLFESFTREDGLPAGMVRAIHPDDDGTLWIGGRQEAAARLAAEALPSASPWRGRWTGAPSCLGNRVLDA